MSLSDFHPIIRHWFESKFESPTEPQRLGWPSIAAGEHTLIAAPTGSGKTLTAFLSVIDRLFKLALQGELSEETRVVYVSPLRALSNDIHRNLEVPLNEIFELAAAWDGLPDSGASCEPIRIGLRTGDTSPSRRAALVRRPPHILVTTPESLYLMLTAEKGRETMRAVDTVIVDEIHALVRDKRGSHLALSLERLEHVSGRHVQRIGLSATQKPIERMAEFLVGSRRGTVARNSASSAEAAGGVDSNAAGTSADTNDGEVRQRAATDVPIVGWPSKAVLAVSTALEGHPTGTLFSSCCLRPRCQIIDVGHGRELDLAIEVPPSELGAVCMHEQWAEVNARVVELINEHRSTLIFVNTRRMAERVTHQLSDLLGEDAVGSHHGSLSADIRLKTERQLKSGELKAVVATASLELGLDVGYIDLVIQLGSPRAIATLLQRIGRSGHSLGVVPKGRLFALTRDELMECMALIRAVRAGRLDAVPIPEAPLDVLAQQIVAEVAAEPWSTDDLFELFTHAYPYRNLSREEFDGTVHYLSEGISHTAGRSRVYLHHDQVGRRIRARKGARIASTTNAGAIPEVGSYRVVTEPEQTVVGTLDEDFAIESQAGSVFLLGNTSWRIQYVRGGDVTVTDAAGAPPTIPFWRGEAPGRTLELSEEVSRLREELESRLAVSAATEASESSDSGTTDTSDVEKWLVDETCCSESAAQQIALYAAAQKAAIGLLPSQKRVVFERFFDESGGMQLVVHAPFGSRINRAWGLAMRKRFCRSFDFELQATADDDGFILSLGPQHSFPLESMFAMLTEANVHHLLEQAVLAVPMFQVRWRWNVTRALLVMRRNNGKKVPPALQRFRANDLLTAVFPTVTGCLENVVGDIELPDHPLIKQTMHDCLTEALDLDHLKPVLANIERGDIELVARDTREPSPFSYELLNANPYAFLDGGEIQERRTRAVAGRRSLTVESVRDLGRLDPNAIAMVRQEAQPLIRDADELHDALLSRIVLPSCEVADCHEWYDELTGQRRATSITLPNGQTAWIAAERLPAAIAVFPDATPEPMIDVPAGVRRDWPPTDARVAVIRGMIEISGPITSQVLAARSGITPSQAAAALEALEGEGVVLSGHFTPEESEESADGDIDQSCASPHAAETRRSTDSATIEWCHRRLLARIHRLTLAGLRQQIEPVDVDVLMRFLTRHHGLLASERRAGPNGLFEVIAQLQGLDIPAICWERDLLPARIDKFRPDLLDELCLTGDVAWGRLFPPRRDLDRSKPIASLTRVAPVSVFLRSDVEWLTANAQTVDAETLSSPAVEMLELLQQRGAVFKSDLMSETRMLPSQLDDTLGELVTRGFVTADGFAGLRQLIAEKNGSSRTSWRRRMGVERQRLRNSRTGRWSIWRSDESDQPAETAADVDAAETGSLSRNEIVEQWAWQLLRRWGVIFRDLLVRENGTPRWWELLQVFRRLEARGEIRGGRFVRGVAGEQFALPGTVRQLRKLRDDGPQQELVVISAADPLNLVGILTDHARVRSTASNRIAMIDGMPVAFLSAGDVTFLTELPNDLLIHIAARLNSRNVSELAIRKFSPSANEGRDREPSNGEPQTNDADSKLRERPQPAYPNGIPRPIIS